jgi:hypothetical protein
MRHKLCLMIIAAFLIGDGGGRAPAAEPNVKAVPASEEDVIPKQWLDRQITVEQAETEQMVDGVPLGPGHDAWKQLKASLQPGDALWTYCSPWESFKALAGRCGIAVVRNGRVVNALVTMMN